MFEKIFIGKKKATELISEINELDNEHSNFYTNARASINNEPGVYMHPWEYKSNKDIEYYGYRTPDGSYCEIDVKEGIITFSGSENSIQKSEVLDTLLCLVLELVIAGKAKVLN